MAHENPFKFCPQCSTELKSLNLKTNEPDRLVCPECGFVFYLDPKVVACSIVVLDRRIVLLKRSIEPAFGNWSMPGGHVDRGEGVEAAACRETREECGLIIRIKNLMGVYSYPGRVTVVIVYLAEVLSGGLAAGDETLEAGLFRQNEIPWDELAFPSTVDALKDYCALKDGCK